MKQKLYTLGLVTTGILFTGTLFKVQHWPGAGYLIILGILTLVFIFLPLALRNHYKTDGNSQNRTLYIVTWITCFVIFIGMLFKIMHWPGAGYALIIALPFPYVVFLPVYLVVTSRNKSFNIYNTVFVLFLLATFSTISALLALNVSMEMTVDSLKIPATYNKVEMVLDKIPGKEIQTPVDQKIDEVLKLVDEFQDLIFKHEGITKEQWNNNTEILLERSSRTVAKAEMLTEREGAIDHELQTALSELIKMVEISPGNELLAKALPEIINMGESRNSNYIWRDALFKGSIQPWSLAYLDGLETNLKFIKMAN
jgi:hypothetical protein